MMLGRTLFGSAIAFMIAVTQAHAVCPAGSIQVSPGFGGAINGAIAAAGTGGTVCLAPGIYTEGATVVINKALTLIGDGATPGEVVIDARDANGGGIGEGIEVENGGNPVNNVRIENLTVQHALGAANIRVNGNGFDAVNIVSRAGQQNCLQIAGDSPEVSGSSFLGCGIAGIEVTGAVGPTITDNVVRGTNSLGIQAGPGINAVVTGNRLSNINSVAISNSVGANNSQFSGNEITNASGGISVSGDGDVLDGNTVKGVDGFGIDVNGRNPRVSNNSVEDADGGFNVVCGGGGPCDQGFVTGNTAFGTGNLGGFEIQATGNSFRIEDNQAVDAYAEGFDLINVVAGSIAGNNTGRTRTGYRLTAGIGNSITDNIARTSAGSGYIINTASNVLTGNEARKNLRDGITIGGTANTLTDTRTVRNKGEGVDLDAVATNTTITNLTSQNNRIDCAADVGATVGPTSSAISCEDGSNFTVASQINDGF